MSNFDKHKLPGKFEDPSDKMAELEDEIIRQDEEDISKYAPKSGQEEVDENLSDSVEEQEESRADEKDGTPDENAVEPEAKDEEAEEIPQDGDSDGHAAETEAAETELEDEGEDPKKTSSKSSLWTNALIGVLAVLLVGMGYLYHEQRKSLPPDPLEVAREEFDTVKKEYDKARLVAFETEKRAIQNQVLREKQKTLYLLQQENNRKEKEIEGLEREILGLRVQMRSYFAQYKEFARKKARGLHFDSLTTVKTKKTYLNVEIQRVTDDSVSIVHAGGATKIAPADLSEALRSRFAYGDPLGLAAMDDEKAAEDKQKEEIGKYLPNVKGFKEDGAATENKPANPAGGKVDGDALLKGDFEPPSKLPNVDTKGGAPSAEPSGASGDELLNDGWVPPSAPLPF